MEYVLRAIEDSQAFSFEAKYDDNFWFVKVFAHEQGNKRHRFTYKINHPKMKRRPAIVAGNSSNKGT
jgi:hypothetical protein